MITSVNNEKIKELIKLKARKERKEKGLFIVEGPHLVKEAKMLGLLEEAYTISEKYEGTLISEECMKKISSTSTPIQQVGVCKIVKKNEIGSNILILDDIQDPGNLGTLLRSAIAFGFDTLFLSQNTVDVYNDKVIRSSQGAIFKLNFLYGDKVEFINSIRNTHTVYGTNVLNGVDINDCEVSKNMAVVLGNEGNGISDEVKNLNLSNIYIEMSNTESLNVGVAGSIIMYELTKRRK